MCHGLLKKTNNLQQNLEELQKSMGTRKLALFSCWKIRVKWGWQPTRLLRFVTFFHLPFSFWSLYLFVASLLFMKGASCCVEIGAVTLCDGKFSRGHSSAWFPLFISACRFVEFDTSNLYLPCVSALFWLTSIARYVFKSPGIWFWETEYDIYCERVACLHISIMWGRAQPWLELFASISTVSVGKFLSRVSYLL